MTPVRAAVEEEDYAAATGLNVTLAGEGISHQAHGLRATILQVDRWAQHAPYRVVEVHPEVSFACLAGVPLDVSKSTWARVARRRQLLARAGIVLTEDLGVAAGKAGVDDVLDVAVAAWTALRVASGQGPGCAGPTREVQRRPAMCHLDVSRAISPRQKCTSGWTSLCRALGFPPSSSR
jgi:predicted RNase H-like nuclease